MKSENYKEGPASVGLVLDKEHNDLLKYLIVTNSPEGSFQDALSHGMLESVTIARVKDNRVLVYEFPDLESIPEPTQENCARYYRDLLLPVVTALDIKPSFEIHSREVVFAVLNDIPIDLCNPQNCIRQRSDYADFTKTFCGGFIDLKNKDTLIKFPSGDQLKFGLKPVVTLELDDEIASKRQVPSIPRKDPKHGII